MNEHTYGTCRECGRPVPAPSANGHQRLYCSKTCAMTWKTRAYHCREYLKRKAAGLPLPPLQQPLI